MRDLKKPKKKAQSYTDSYLLQLWRKAVLAYWGNKCFFCGNPKVDELECHHIIRRGENRLLRWDFRNSIPVCKYPKRDGEESCHQYAKSLEGIEEIKERHPFWKTLETLEHQTLKDMCVQYGMTSSEFRTAIAKELKEVIEKYGKRVPV